MKLSVRSPATRTRPGEKPTLLLTATNSSGGDCKVDLGPKSAVLTITEAGSDDDYWSSADCPEGAGSLVFRAPARQQHHVHREVGPQAERSGVRDARRVGRRQSGDVPVEAQTLRKATASALRTGTADVRLAA